MLKKPITFENFEGERVTEIHYFNLTKIELIDMELSADGGSLAAQLTQIVAEGNPKALMEMLQKIILKAYGIKDGTRFKKSDEISADFAESLAYDALFSEIVTSETASAEFITALVPKDVLADMAEAENVKTIELPEKMEEAPKKELTPAQLSKMSKAELIEAFKQKASG